MSNIHLEDEFDIVTGAGQHGRYATQAQCVWLVHLYQLKHSIMIRFIMPQQRYYSGI